MDLRFKCKNKQYANCVIQVAKLSNACKFCARTPQRCKYSGDHKNCWKVDSEYCFDGVRSWLTWKGNEDFYTMREEQFI